MGRLAVSWATDLCNENERHDCKHPMQQYILHLLHLLDLPGTRCKGPWCGFCKLHNCPPQYPTPREPRHSTSWFRSVWPSWWKCLVRLEHWNPHQRALESYLCLLKPSSAIKKTLTVTNPSSGGSVNDFTPEPERSRILRDNTSRATQTPICYPSPLPFYI